MWWQSLIFVAVSEQERLQTDGQTDNQKAEEREAEVVPSLVHV